MKVYFQILQKRRDIHLNNIKAQFITEPTITIQFLYSLIYSYNSR